LEDELGVDLKDELGLVENDPDLVDVLGALPVFAANAGDVFVIKSKVSKIAKILFFIYPPHLAQSIYNFLLTALMEKTIDFQLILYHSNLNPILKNNWQN
jgi:hypothetical protein